MQRDLLGLLVALIVAPPWMGACGERPDLSPAGSAAPRPAAVVVPIDRDPGLLDPLRASDPAVARVTVLVHEGLVVLDDSLRVHPGVARSWSTSGKGKRLTFKLDENARFADGRALRTADVRFTLERLLDPLTESPLGRYLAQLEGVADFQGGKAATVAGIRTVDSLTIELRFRRAFGPILNCLADPQAAVVPADLAPGETPAGLGPWVVRSHDPGRTLTLVGRSGYHGDPPHAAELELVVMPDRWRQRAAFAAGELDLLELLPGMPPPARAGAYPPLAVVDWSTTAVAINCQKYPFDSWRVRQALNHGADLATIMQGLRGGTAVRANGPLPPGMPGDATQVESFDYRPAWARELLQAAGFARGFHMEIWYEYSPAAAQLLDALRLGLHEVGVELRAVDCTREERRRAIERGTADAVLCTVRPTILGAAPFLRERFDSGNFGPDGNLAAYESRQVDRLLGRLDSTGEAAARARLAAETEQRLHRAAPWIYLWHPRRIVATAPGLTGYRVMPDERLQRYLTIHQVAGRITPPVAAAGPAED